MRSPLPIVDRYLAKEILLPFLAGLLFLTQLLLATQLLSKADVLFGSGVSLVDIGSIVVALLPNVLGYVLPIAFLLGSVIGVGRLSEDREIIALGAAGISPARLVRVPLVLGVLATAAGLWLSTTLEPAGFVLARERINDVVKRNVTNDVRAGTFYDQIPGYTLYAERTQAGRWENVLISDRTNPAAPVLALARSGHLEPVGTGKEMRLLLDAGELHHETRSAARAEVASPSASAEAASDQYVAAEFRHADVVIGLGNVLSERNALNRTAREMDGAAFDRRIAEARRARNETDAHRFEGYKHRRYAQPMATIPFALFAVPLGASRRIGRAFAMAATVLAVIAQYVLMRGGQVMAERGVLPAWLALQTATVVLTALAVWMIAAQARRGPGAVR